MYVFPDGDPAPDPDIGSGHRRRDDASYKRRHGDTIYNAMQQQWTIPERLIARRPAPAAPGWEVLVKWTGLGCEHCTWEVSVTSR